MTTAAVVGAVILASCSSSVAQSTMSFESSPAPTMRSRIVDTRPVRPTGDGVKPQLVSAVAPSVAGDSRDPSTGSDQAGLLTSARVPLPAGPSDESGTAESFTAGPQAADTSRQNRPSTGDMSGIIDDAGATLVAHAVSEQVVAYDGPGSDRIVVRLDNPTNHGGPLVFQAVTSPVSTQVEFGWIEVLLPVRPNSTTGWIRTADVDLSINPYRIEVDVDDFTLTVYRNNAPYLTAPVGIGRGQTPTPEGSFYLAELLRPSDPHGSYGPYAYGLSGFSEVLDSFAGGEGVIGIHGTNEPWAIGTNVSHGCIRVDNSVIEALATFLPLGTPVDIGV